ncbi:MAG TPA: hypothetical protein LFW21_07335 [Rickettsia endosymbiont of Pyrocoelia pectoralis]|nr:hypothetical protein [Rickettsia endosymbiont of Pyrocoelia pectoralis]
MDPVVKPRGDTECFFDSRNNDRSQ